MSENPMREAILTLGKAVIEKDPKALDTWLLLLGTLASAQMGTLPLPVNHADADERAADLLAGYSNAIREEAAADEGIDLTGTYAGMCSAVMFTQYVAGICEKALGLCSALKSGQELTPEDRNIAERASRDAQRLRDQVRKDKQA